jgi:rhamnose transport system substrate-binding protein
MNRAGLLPVLLTLFLAAGCGDSGGGKEAGTGAPAPAPGAATGGGKIKIAMIPKSRVAYFNACERGGKEAAEKLGDVEFSFEGPTEDKTEEQARLLRAQSVRGIQAIAIACNDANQIAPVIKEARDGGTHVLTYDSDANPSTSGREFFVNQATVEDIAEALVEEMVAQVGPEAEVAVVSSTPTAPNQVAWLAAMKAYREKKYPKLNQVTIEYGGEDQALSMQKTQAILNAYPNVKGLWAITSVAFPGAAQAVERAGKAGKIAVVGLSTPVEMAGFVDRGVVKTVILWNPVDLGFLTVYAARAVVRGELKPGMTSFKADRLGEKQIVGDQILLGKPMRFTKENIHNFDF